MYPWNFLVFTCVIFEGVQHFSLSESMQDAAGQLSDRLKMFVGQKRKLLDQSNRSLICLNTGLSIFSKYCKFDRNMQEICAYFYLLKTKLPKSIV